MEKKQRFSFWYALFAVLLNGGAVFFINVSSGGVADALKAGSLQLFLSFIVAGVAVPVMKRCAQMKNVWLAYSLSSFGIGFVIAAINGVIHWCVGTPNVLGTMIWLLAVNIVGGLSMVLTKRHQHYLPERLARAAKKL